MDKILVIGLGSMGKRRIRLILKHFSGWEIQGVDFNFSRCLEVEREYKIKTWSSIDEAVEYNVFKCAFVCTSPLSHEKIIEKCLNKNINVFTEINLVQNGYDKNIQLANEKGLLLFLSSTMIYKDEMMYLKKCIQSEKKYGYSYHVGQYLPDWHPWESYKNFFVGNKETNACREILAIELPWLVYVFGEIENISYTREKITNLDIEYDDMYMLLIKHKNGNIGTFIVDVASCEAVRDLKIISENFYLKWEGEPNKLYEKHDSSQKLNQIKLYDNIEHQEGYNKTIAENEYVNELNQFFGELSGTRRRIYGFEEDKIILNYIDEVEEL